jgi:hypothetical protein
MAIWQLEEPRIIPNWPGWSVFIPIVTTDDVAFPGNDGQPILEPGLIEVWVGPSAEREGLIKAELTVEV